MSQQIGDAGDIDADALRTQRMAMEQKIKAAGGDIGADQDTDSGVGGWVVAPSKIVPTNDEVVAIPLVTPTEDTQN